MRRAKVSELKGAGRFLGIGLGTMLALALLLFVLTGTLWSPWLLLAGFVAALARRIYELRAIHRRDVTTLDVTQNSLLGLLLGKARIEGEELSMILAKTLVAVGGEAGPQFTALVLDMQKAWDDARALEGDARTEAVGALLTVAEDLPVNEKAATVLGHDISGLHAYIRTTAKTQRALAAKADAPSIAALDADKRRRVEQENRRESELAAIEAKRTAALQAKRDWDSMEAIKSSRDRVADTVASLGLSSKAAAEAMKSLP